jgi:hypothetical protein
MTVTTNPETIQLGNKEISPAWKSGNAFLGVSTNKNKFHLQNPCPQDSSQKYISANEALYLNINAQHDSLVEPKKVLNDYGSDFGEYLQYAIFSKDNLLIELSKLSSSEIMALRDSVKSLLKSLCKFKKVGAYETKKRETKSWNLRNWGKTNHAIRVFLDDLEELSWPAQSIAMEREEKFVKKFPIISRLRNTICENDIELDIKNELVNVVTKTTEFANLNPNSPDVKNYTEIILGAADIALDFKEKKEYSRARAFVDLCWGFYEILTQGALRASKRFLNFYKELICHPIETTKNIFCGIGWFAYESLQKLQKLTQMDFVDLEDFSSPEEYFKYVKYRERDGPKEQKEEWEKIKTFCANTTQNFIENPKESITEVVALSTEFILHGALFGIGIKNAKKLVTPVVRELKRECGIVAKIAHKAKISPNPKFGRIQRPIATFVEKTCKKLEIRLGKIFDVIRVSSEEIDQIERYLASIDALDNPLNKSMLKRLKSGNLAVEDTFFVKHELLESKLVAEGIPRIKAHKIALEKLDHSPWQIYNPEVVKVVDKKMGVKTMSPDYYKFWGLK